MQVQTLVYMHFQSLHLAGLVTVFFFFLSMHSLYQRAHFSLDCENCPHSKVLSIYTATLTIDVGQIVRNDLHYCQGLSSMVEHLW